MDELDEYYLKAYTKIARRKDMTTGLVPMSEWLACKERYALTDTEEFIELMLRIDDKLAALKAEDKEESSS